MRNQYRGICYRCGGIVEPGAGHFQKVTSSEQKKWGHKILGKKWLTQHADCAIKYKGTTIHHEFNPSPEFRQ